MAISYLMDFVTLKAFLDLKSFYGIVSGVFSLYGCISITGVVYVYYKLREIEGKNKNMKENCASNKLHILIIEGVIL
ncbi:hypothetical protein PGB90_004772 [Kerria lacca]